MGVAAKGHLVGMDIVEVNPSRSQRAHGADRGAIVGGYIGGGVSVSCD